MSKFYNLEGQSFVVESTLSEITQEGFIDKIKSIDWREKWEAILEKLHQLVEWIIDKVKEFKNKLRVEKWKEVKVNKTLDIDWFDSSMVSKVRKYAEDIMTCNDDDTIREMGNRLTRPQGGNYPFKGKYVEGWVKVDAIQSALLSVLSVADKIDQMVDVCRKAGKVAMQLAVKEKEKSSMSHETSTAKHNMYMCWHQTDALSALLNIVNGDLERLTDMLGGKEKK